MASRIVPFLIFGVLNFGGLAIGSMATGPGVSSEWYAGLAKAPWTPPGWVFGAAWTTVMLGFTWFMTSAWARAESAADKKGQALWFGLAWGLNVAWNPLFFGLQATGVALFEILSLYAVIAAVAARNWSTAGAGRWGVVPYLVWLAIATSLNAYVVWANGPEVQAPAETASVGWPESEWDEAWKVLDGAIEWAVEEGQIPGAVLLIRRNGEVAVHEAYGAADPMTGRPMERDALFRICSQSKAITSTAAMVLWERGLLNLDAPVAQYLPEFEGIGVIDSLMSDTTFTVIPAEQVMTVRHLMTHTSGISYGEIGDPRFEALYDKHDIVDLFPRDGRTTRENAQKIASTCLIHSPGSQWNYSLGLDVLVAVVEAASGRDYAEFVEEEVLAPLGMFDTHFALPEADANRLVMVSEPVPVVGGFKRHEHPRYTIDYPRHPEWPLCSGGAGLTSTAEDYARFLQCYLDRGRTGEGRLLEESTVDTVMADHAPGLLDGGWNQGLAFGVRNGGEAEGAFFWGGYFNTQYFAHPASQTAVVLMKQTYGVNADSTSKAIDAMLWN